MNRNVALRTLAGMTAGLVGWIIVATLCNLLVRTLLPGYRDVESSMNFTLLMQVCRLLTGATASIVCGLLAARVARASRWAPLLSGLFLLLFIPVHVSLWDRFPAWYHLTFLASLALLPPLAARATSPAAT